MQEVLAWLRLPEGAAVDPLTLDPVDDVVISALVDHSYGGLLLGGERVRRPALASSGIVAAPQPTVRGRSSDCVPSKVAPRS